ncbi:MAG TPA: hypothetical protein VMT11_17500 [Myxococcaceae bacterium]|nr:hypothetical protein [Myxococcaceae bacterium]
MVFTPRLVSGIGALLFTAIGVIVGLLGPALLSPLWRMFGARTVPLSVFASVGLGLFGGFVAGMLTPFFAPAGEMFYPVWWGFLLAAANAGGVVFTGAMIASVPGRTAGY